MCTFPMTDSYLFSVWKHAWHQILERLVTTLATGRNAVYPADLRPLGIRTLFVFLCRRRITCAVVESTNKNGSGSRLLAWKYSSPPTKVLVLFMTETVVFCAWDADRHCQPRPHILNPRSVLRGPPKCGFLVIRNAPNRLSMP